MGDMISSLLFQPPPPTRLKESKVIWLTNSFGKRIPAFFIECPKDERGEGVRAPLPGEGGGGGANSSYYSKGSSGKSQGNHTLATNGSRNNNNSSSTPPSSTYGAGEEMQVPSTPQIRTSKELEMSMLNSSGSGRGGGSGGGGGRLGGISSCVPTILYSHANAEDLGNIYPWCKFLSKMLGVNVFAYDYTGYGLATDQGECSVVTLFMPGVGGWCLICSNTIIALFHFQAILQKNTALLMSQQPTLTSIKHLKSPLTPYYSTGDPLVQDLLVTSLPRLPRRGKQWVVLSYMLRFYLFTE